MWSLRLKKIPVFYTPYISFPIDFKRKTGFLFPSFARSSDSGYDISVPYYINLAPNYDLTLIPRYMSKRGVQGGLDFRYLTKYHEGDIRGTYLPSDDEFDDFRGDAATKYSGSPNLSKLLNEGSDRSFISINNLSEINDNWSGRLKFNWVSDDYYFQDFGGSPSGVNKNQLPREAIIQYVDQYWDILARVENYQTLHPVNQQPIENQYSRYPQIALSGFYPNIRGLNAGIHSEFTYFDKSRNPEESEHPINGARFNIQPSLHFPYQWSHGYFEPGFELQATFYNLSNQLDDEAQHITRMLPMISIDNGMYLEKETTVFNKTFTQTLEPRVFYLFVPFESQQDIPLFDTALSNFNFDQLFEKNRFNGLDRTGDENRLSVGLTSRFYDDETGQERVRLGIGQAFNFQGREVVLCDSPICDNDKTTLNARSTESHLSPLVGQVDYYVNESLYFESGLAWDRDFGEVTDAFARGYYKQGDHKIINLGYTFLRSGDVLKRVSDIPTDDSVNNLSQADAAVAWPLGERWHVVGRMNYNLSHHHTQNYFAGLQYDSCCWVFRLIASRKFKSFNERDNPEFENDVYVQLQFKGLGSIRSGDAGKTLREGIPGYGDSFDQGLF